ncbi:MAG: phosphoribulokinase [Pseudomonadota bacterium]
MSAKFPIIAVTGSSGSGTTRSQPLFERMFTELGVRAGFVEGDSFHVYDREQSQSMLERARVRGENFSHFGPAANYWDRLEALFEQFGESGTGMVRRYLHTEADAQSARQNVGTFTPWGPMAPADVLFYEGLHGGVVVPEIDIARHADLLIGMTPTVNLEWIQKIHRDTNERGYDAEAVAHTILRRMPDYVTYITPQFSRTDVNFQRVPLVDTSNPFIVRDVPAAEESLVVVHMNPHSRLDVDFYELLTDIPDTFLSRPDTLVVRGEHMELAMELTLKPALERLIKNRR